MKRNLKYYFILLFILNLGLPNYLFSQKEGEALVDSLIQYSLTLPDDTNKINVLVDIAFKSYSLNPVQGITIGNKALALAEQLKWKKGIASAHSRIGINYYGKGDYANALEHYNNALFLFEEIGDKKSVGGTLGNIGIVYKLQSDFPKAVEYYFKALKIAEQLGDKKRIAANLLNIGNIHDMQSESINALECYFKSLKIYQELDEQANIATLMVNIGLAYFNLNKYESSLEYSYKAKKMYEKLEDVRGLGNVFNNIGRVYDKQREYEKALEFYFKSLKAYTELEDESHIAICYGNLGACYLSIVENNKSNTLINNFEGGRVVILNKAKEYCLKAVEIQKKLEELDNIKYSYLNLSIIYKMQNNFKEALENYQDFIQVRDSVYNEENKKRSIVSEMNYEYEKKQVAENAKLEQERAITEADKKRQRLILISVISVLLLVVLFAVVVVNRWRVTRRQNAIIESARKTIEYKNKEITDSIHYAKRIQSTILPSAKYVTELLPQSFVLYMPKDIVAGDFYWLEKTGTGDERRGAIRSTQSSLDTRASPLILLAACDCTGHGVPGAMVSVVCHNALNKAMHEFEIYSPAKILDKVKQLVVDDFSKNNEDGDVKDGMDVSLCVINMETKTVEWAGANNPLYIITASGELKELKGDKQPIGKTDESYPFTLHTLQMQTGDTIYLTTDGYADQFGGDNERKFQKKRMKELLLEINNLNMAQQKFKLRDVFETWRGSMEQVDDVCVVGVRF